jgi:hypothetical protein
MQFTSLSNKESEKISDANEQILKKAKETPKPAPKDPPKPIKEGIDPRQADGGKGDYLRDMAKDDKADTRREKASAIPLDQPAGVGRDQIARIEAARAKLKTLAGAYKEAKQTNAPNLISLRSEVVDTIADVFEDIAQDAVKQFEGDNLKTTRGNYGKYMQFLSNESFKGLYLHGIIKALRKAGAGQGLSDATRIIMGNF